MTLLDSLWSFSKEPLLLVMFVLTVIILFLTVRLVFRRRNVVEKELVSPLEMLNNEYQRVSEVTSIVQEIRLVRNDKTVDTKISFQKDKEKVDPDINRLCNIIESTNFLKRLVRFHERGQIR